jgi:uncharacterized protein (TIGR03790 family)
MMVARLDGPTRAIAQGLVDKAMAAEAVVLRGKAYFDTRGRRDAVGQHGSYGWYDEGIRQAAEMVREKTALEVVVDDKEELFGAGACPETVLYCGWYSLRKYVDAFEFKEGAVGFHVASFEAETLLAGESQVWAKRLLEEGITATLGPVDEPFLHTFPAAEVFFRELVSGEYTLVEAYYRAKPYNSWQMVLVGDPLYRPRFAQKRGFLAK